MTSPEAAVATKIDNFIQPKTSDLGERSSNNSFKSLPEEFSVTEKTAHAIDSNLAEIVKSLLLEKLAKDKLAEVQNKYLGPQNCTNLVAPKIKLINKFGNSYVRRLRTREQKNVLTHDSLEDVQWWSSNIPSASRKILHNSSDVVVYTDAFQTGWGAPGGAGSETWNQVCMTAAVKKFGQARLSTGFMENKHGGLP